MYTLDGDPGGRVQWTANGDVAKLCDIEADGWAVRLRVDDWETGAFNYSYTIGGNGRCIELRASLGGKYDLIEGHRFLFEICLVSDTDVDYCNNRVISNVN